MSYPFYCTSCGKRLVQRGKRGENSVLFDMTPLIFGKENKGSINWFMTYNELTGLFRRGEKIRGGKMDDYYKVEISFEDFIQSSASQIGAPSDIRSSLNLENLQAYVDSGEKASLKDGHKDEDDDSGEEESPKPAVEPVAPAESNPFEYFIARGKDANPDEKARDALRKELKEVQSAFLNSKMTIYIKQNPEKDDKEEDVLEGYSFYYHYHGNEDEYRMFRDVRVCPICKKRVFRHAGEAEHRAITFVGPITAGKTSTIVALADYISPSKKEKWRDAEPLTNVDVELCNDGEGSGRLERDKKLYGEGYAPEKTSIERKKTSIERKEAYSATFLVKPRGGGRRQNYLITLYDLPGELFGGEDGTSDEIEITTIGKDYPIAVNCDAFVVCFDTTQGFSGKREGDGSWSQPDVDRSCKWVSEIQKVRCKAMKTEYFAPMIILFTKCAELEQGEKHAGEDTSDAITPYIFEAEKRGMQELKEKNGELYKSAIDKFNNDTDFHKAYHAALRCSPYGFPAMKKSEAEEKGETTAMSSEKETPINVDKLMKWILMVCGCVPVNTEYREDGDESRNWHLNGFYIDRPQYRGQNPKLDRGKEALARCVLFANPGYYDKHYPAYREQRSDFWERFSMNLRMLMENLLGLESGNLKED